jgi:protein-S-isoprenylcysteine O-methyltransferase Ste14
VFDVYSILQIAASILGIWAIRSVGENNWSVYPIPNEESDISAKGAYKIIRHPMYTALILFFLPVAIRADGFYSWSVYIFLVLTLLVKVLYEERQIFKKHPEYANYKTVTKKRLVPFIW